MKLALCLLVTFGLTRQDPVKERLETSPRHLECEITNEIIVM